MRSERDSKFIYIEDNFSSAIKKTAEIIDQGGIIIYPTDTIYGLGTEPYNSLAVKRLDKIKKREKQKNYILLIHTVEILKFLLPQPEIQKIEFLRYIWPDAVSVVLNLNDHYKDILGMAAAAFRISKNLFCQSLTSELNKSLISTSVKKSGEIPLVDPLVTKSQSINLVDLILCSKDRVNHEAFTIIDFTGSYPILIREGVVNYAKILTAFNTVSNDV